MNMQRKVKPADFGDNFVCETEPKVRISADGKKRLDRSVSLRCKHCDKIFTVTMANAKRTKQKCCSVKCYQKMIEVFDGGNERHPLYSRWLAMTQRCTTPTCNQYKNYGARGIYIEKYLTVFKNYVEYVSGLPGYIEADLQRITLDRIDNHGSYIRGNLRWTNHSMQIVNQRIRKHSSSYKGVTWNKRRKTWLSRLTFKGVNYCYSTHKELDDAVRARNIAIYENNLPHKIQEIN